MTGKIISAEVFINGTKEFTYKLNNGQDITVEYDKYGLANISREALEVLLEVSTEGEEERAIQKEVNSVLDKIRKEVTELVKTYPFVNHLDTYVKEDDVLAIIDRYKDKGVEE